MSPPSLARFASPFARYAIVVMAVAVLALGAFFLLRKKTKPTSLPPPAAEIVRIRRTADKHLTLYWTFPAGSDSTIDHMQVAVADEDGYGIPVSGVLPRTTRSWTDPRQLKDGQEIMYSILALGEKDARTYSVEKEIIYRDSPVPPQIEGLRAEFTSIAGRAYEAVSWDAPPATDTVTRGYQIFNSAWPQTRAAFIPRWRGRERLSPFLIELSPETPKRFILEVVAVTDVFQESAPSRITVETGVEFPVPPSDVRVRRDAEPVSSLLVTWAYPARSAKILKGFRMYDGELLIADESKLPAEAREWSDNILVVQRPYRYAVAAVSSAGLYSARATAPELILAPEQVRPPVAPPSELMASWVENGDQLAIQLNWAASPMSASNRFVLAVAPETGNGAAFREVDGGAAIAATGYRFAPPDITQAYAFKLYSVAADGRRSVPVTGYVPAPDKLVAPARLLDCRVIEEGSMQRLEWVWQYPTSTFLRGFRIYQDGKLVADEAILRADTRSWKTEPLTKGVIYSFEIEAVAKNGRPAARSPARSYEPM